MGRAIQIASAILAISASVCVLVTPDLGDDVDGVSYKRPLDLSPVFGEFHVGGLISAVAIPILALACASNHSVQLLDLICARLC